MLDLKRSNKRYYVLKRELRKSEVAIVREDNFGNYIYLETFYKRFYPNGETSSHLLGFTGSQGEGQEGLEYALNSGLSGRNGLKKTLTDIHQNSIADIEMVNDPMIGEDFYSSVDIKIQHFAHQALKSAIEKHNAKGGHHLYINYSNLIVVKSGIKRLILLISIMFRGLNKISLDTKGRISIPTKYRSELAKYGSGKIQLCGIHHAIC